MTSAKDELQKAILDIFADALGTAIAADEDFFAAGGDSLAAERALIALSGHLLQDVPGWLLIDYPSAAALSAALRPADGQGRTTSE
jgi:hypothetical protein